MTDEFSIEPERYRLLTESMRNNGMRVSNELIGRMREDAYKHLITVESEGDVECIAVVEERIQMLERWI